MAFQEIVRDRATQDIRRQANYILANGNQEKDFLRIYTIAASHQG
ncbi:hypothetical protein [Pseudanabaena minima]